MEKEQGSYLERFDAAAPADRFPLVRRWIDEEPLPLFKELREKRPILVTPVCTIVTRFDDVTELLNLPKVFTVALYLPKMENGIYLMAHDDDALHSREKAIMQSMLNRDDLPQVRAMVADSSRELLSAAKGTLEAVNGYCRRVPATIVQKYFGLIGIDLGKLIEWSYWSQVDTFYNQPFDILTDARRREITDRHTATGKELETYVTELMVGLLLAVNLERAKHFLFGLWYLFRMLLRKMLGKTSQPLTDTIVTRMIRTAYPEAANFDIKRLGVNAGGLLIGAIETTSQAVAQVIQYLLDRPDLYSQAAAAARSENVAAFDGIVWEALRFVPISPYLFRQAASDYTVGKGTDHATLVNAGSYVLAVTQSAMFDPRSFESPDEFRPGRNWYHYFHFGFGSHECLGKYVGMVMIPEMVRQMLRLPGLRAAGKIDYQGGHLPERFDLSWTPSAG
ncbi:MAG TPA: cytochrome P450 [Planctomycetota bacterium]|nr:cytochrome P450 [Planctomycetota bacterium]